MAQYKLDGSGNFVNSSGERLYKTYKLDGSGRYVDDQGNEAGGNSAYATRKAPVKNEKGLRQQVFEQIKDADKRAFDANEARREEIMEGHRVRNERVIDSYKKITKGDLAAINRKFDQLKAQEIAKANSSGMGQSTTLTTILQGIERERARALGDANDRRTMNETNAVDSIDRDRLGFVERVEDLYPNTEAYLRLAELEGSGSQEGMIDPMLGGMIGGGAPIFLNNPYGNPLGFGAAPIVAGPQYGQKSLQKPTGPTLGQLRNAKKAATPAPTPAPSSPVPYNPFVPNSNGQQGTFPVVPLPAPPVYTPPAYQSPPIPQPKVPAPKPLTFSPVTTPGTTYTPGRSAMPGHAPGAILPGYSADELPAGFFEYYTGK